MSLKVSAPDGVKVTPHSVHLAVLATCCLSHSCMVRHQVYNVTSSKKQPQWVSDKKKKGLRKDEEYRWARSQRLQQGTVPPLRFLYFIWFMAMLQTF